MNRLVLLVESLECFQRLLDINDGTAVCRWFLIVHDVLLQDVVSVKSGFVEFVDDLGEIDVALANGCEHAGLDAFAPCEFAGQKLVGHFLVDVLGVDDVDAVGVLVDQFDYVCATAGEVAGIQAQADLRVVQDALDFVNVLHHGAPVRVQARDHVALGACG